TIAKPITLTDAADAPKLNVSRGEIRFEDVTFGYGRERALGEDGLRPFAVLEGFSLTVRPGEKIGLVGRSGAGKSTVVNLLLRFWDVDGGRILVDGQDVREVTQESLRAQIGVVTQDTALLHRSVRENILYGRPDADDTRMRVAAQRA